MSPARPPRRSASELAALLGRRPNTAGAEESGSSGAEEPGNQEPDTSGRSQGAEESGSSGAEEPGSLEAKESRSQGANSRTRPAGAKEPGNRGAREPRSQGAEESGSRGAEEPARQRFGFRMTDSQFDTFEDLIRAVTRGVRPGKVTRGEIVIGLIRLANSDDSIKAAVIEHLKRQ